MTGASEEASGRNLALLTKDGTPPQSGVVARSENEMYVFHSTPDYYVFIGRDQVRQCETGETVDSPFEFTQIDVGEEAGRYVGRLEGKDLPISVWPRPWPGCGGQLADGIGHFVSTDNDGSGTAVNNSNSFGHSWEANGRTPSGEAVSMSGHFRLIWRRDDDGHIYIQNEVNAVNVE